MSVAKYLRKDQVEKEENVFPMVPSKAAVSDIILDKSMIK